MTVFQFGQAQNIGGLVSEARLASPPADVGYADGPIRREPTVARSCAAALPARLALACLLVAVFAVMLSLPGSASAALPEIEVQHMSEVEEWVYRNGASSNSVSCGTVCADLWKFEHGSTPQQSQSLWDALGKLEVSTELWGQMSELAALLGTPELKPGAFEIGWRIGFEHEKWLKVGTQAEAAPSMVGCSAPAIGLMPPGHKFGPTEHESIGLSEWAYVLTDNACGSPSEIEADTNKPEVSPCKPIGSNASPGAAWLPVQWWWNENSCGFNEHGELVITDMIAHGWYAPFHFGRPEDWTGQNINGGHNLFTASAHDPGVAAVKAATEAALERSSALSGWVQEGLELSLGAAQEGYGPGSESAPSKPKCMLGKPVNCATGNEVESETDLTVGGRGRGLRLTRTYNSQLAAKQSAPGACGYGWTCSYGAHLEVNGELATVYQDDGSTVRFTRSGEQWAAVGPLIQATLLQEGSSYVYTLPNQTKLSFNGAGQLTSEADRNGNALTMSRNAEGRLESVGDPTGRKLTLAYNAEGLLESARDPMGHTVKYAYEAGNLASVTEPGEASPRRRFKYNTSHELTTRTDGLNHSVTIEYDASNRVISQTDALERKRTWEYATTESATTTTVTEPNGATLVEQFNNVGLPTSVTHASGTSLATTTTYEYDGAYNLRSVTDGDGHKTEYGYDGTGDRTSMIDANKNETKWAYDSTHDVISTTTPKGEATTIKRDSHGNAEAIERPAPGSTTQVTKYKYNTLGELEATTDPLGRTWKYEYDSAGDRTAEIDPEGDKRTWGYNEDSQETATVSPRGNVVGGEPTKYTTTIERDPQGRPLKVVDPLGHATKYAYDANGNLETQTDPNSHTTTYTYDADNEPTKIKEPNGTVTETGYDSAGKVTSQSDGNKHETKYVRNALEQVSEAVDPLGRKTIKEYDPAGNLKAMTDAAKRTTTYTYDPANRLKEVSYSDGKTHAVKYEYNADGDRTSMVDNTGTVSCTYDQLDRLTESKDGHGDIAKYEYDLANQQTKITYPNGKAVTRSYDKAGRLEKVIDWLEHTTKFSYDPDSRLSSVTFPSGTSNVDKYGYDEADQMSEVKIAKASETLASLVYTRDNDGQLKATTSKGLPGEEKPADEYDANNRLTKAGTIGYEYDAADNPTKTGSITSTYDNASELKTATSLTYAHDELGERTKRTPTAGPATSYGYDEAGNLTSVERPKEGKTSELKDAYGYDGNGLRASQTISGTTSYLTWSTTDGLPLILNDGVNSYVYGPGGLPVEQINTSTGAVTYLHHDQQGSTRLLTGSTGTVTGKCTYGAYGTPTCEGTTTTPLGYDGQYTSSDTGLIYLRARVYDPGTAQFLSVDPLVKLTGAPYNYAGDNPLNNEDPSGLAWQVCVGGSVSLGFVTLGGDLCYVSTPGGSGVAATGSVTGGVGFGANVHVGAGGSNACTPQEYGGLFGQVGASATGFIGGYGNGFSNVGIPGHGRTVVGGTGGVTAGLGVDAGGGPSETAVIGLTSNSSGACGCSG